MYQTALSESERALALEGSKELKALDTAVRPMLQLGEKLIPLPEAAIPLLAAVLQSIGEGRSVTIYPMDRDMTTQEAADMLGVSRPHLIGLLERGAIPYHKVGSHRRVKFMDVLQYQDGSLLGPIALD